MDGREPLVHRCVRELRYEGAVSPPCPLSETSTWPNTLSRPSMVSPLCTWRASSPWPQPFIVITLDKPPQTVSIFPCPRPTSGRRPFNYIMVPICGTPLSASAQNVSTISAFNSFVNPFLFTTYIMTHLHDQFIALLHHFTLLHHFHKILPLFITMHNYVFFALGANSSPSG